MSNKVGGIWTKKRNQNIIVSKKRFQIKNMGFMIPSTLKYHTTSKLSLCDPSWPFKDSQPLCHPPYISLHQCDTALHQKDLLIRKHDIRQDAQSVTSKDFHGGLWQHVTSCKLLHKVNTLIWLILKSPVIPTLCCYRHNEFSVTLLYRFYKFLPIFFPLASSNNFPSILATLTILMLRFSECN